MKENYKILSLKRIILLTFLLSVLCYIVIFGSFYPVIYEKVDKTYYRHKSLSISPSYTTAYILGSTYNVPYDEQYYDKIVTLEIYNNLSSADWLTYYLYGTKTTKDAILESSVKGTVFYIGHGSSEIVVWSLFPFIAHTHWYIFDDSGGKAYDYEIGSINDEYGSYSKLVFMWACHQGEVIGNYYYFMIEKIYYGMPISYDTHSNYISTDAYEHSDSNGYLFLGFKYLAPFLNRMLTLTHNSNYYIDKGGFYFLQRFYYAIKYDLPANNAIDYAIKYMIRDGYYDHYGVFPPSNFPQRWSDIDGTNWSLERFSRSGDDVSFWAYGDISVNLAMSSGSSDT